MSESIAVIGMGCRFPSANDTKAFWELLCNSVDAIKEVPSSRWDAQQYYDPNPNIPSKMVTRWGGFLDQLDMFDPYFFGISPKEAACMDPQQRLLLEVTWEALEDAGLVSDSLFGTKTGVFVGIFTGDYGRLQLRNYSAIDPYTNVGTLFCVAANRLSYAFGFNGPSVALDTACSSSLVAVHLACQSLLQGETSLAVAGGVNVMVTPDFTIATSKGGMMSPDGRCKTFDVDANGYVRGEGAGVVILKRLSDAIADNDPIYAVIRGTAVNNDGRSNGLTVPSAEAQEAVANEAYKKAGVEPGQVQYVEAHGTGTPVGDPIETRALGRVLGQGREKGERCLIGSLKTNIGHLEAAAGIAGLIKVCLMLKHKQVPASINLVNPNPAIDFDNLPLEVVKSLREWPKTEKAMAGINSFGFGGTNAHAVVEEAPYIESKTDKREIESNILTLSAKTKQGVEDLAKSYIEFLSTKTSQEIKDIAYTASVRRTHHDYRMALSAENSEGFIEKLKDYLSSEEKDKTKRIGKVLPIVYVFSGQGPQWWAMGRELYEQEPIFREQIDACDKYISKHSEWSLIDELIKAKEEDSRINRTEITQPAIFAIQVALARLWQNFGIEPAAVVGHSVGEIAAAVIAGIISLEDGCHLVYLRGKLMQTTSGKGKTAAVEMTFDEGIKALKGYEKKVSIAAYNSPNSITLSGQADALDEILEELGEKGIFCRLLKASNAFHSPEMDEIRPLLENELKEVKVNEAKIPIYSTVTGTQASGEEFNWEYWGKNLRQAVLFASAIKELAEKQEHTYLEISPNPVLGSSVSQCLRAYSKPGRVLTSLKRGESERVSVLSTLSTLYTLGYSINWSGLYPTGNVVALPLYPWQRERFWFDAGSEVSRHGGTHKLLGWHLQSAAVKGSHFWEVEIDTRYLPFLQDHKIQGVVVFPGTAYVEMVLAGANEAFGKGYYPIADINFYKGLFLAENTPQTLQLVLAKESEQACSFQIYSRPTSSEQDKWVHHVGGKIMLQQQQSLPKPISISEVKRACQHRLTQAEYYSKLQELGNNYGAAFQGVSEVWFRDNEVLAHLRLPTSIENELEGYYLHPAYFDAALHAAMAATQDLGSAIVPVNIGKVSVYNKPSASMWSYITIQPSKENKNVLMVDIQLLDENSSLVATVEGLRVQSLEEKYVSDNPANWIYEIGWQEVKAASFVANCQGQNWWIFADNRGVGKELASIVNNHGGRAILVFVGQSYQESGNGDFQIQPGNLDDLQKLFTRLEKTHPANHIAHLWALNSKAFATSTLADVLEAQKLGTASLLPLVQVLAHSEQLHQARLWLVTSCSQGVKSNDQVEVSQAPVWGFGRVVAQEQPNLWGGLIDLDSVKPTSTNSKEILSLSAKQLFIEIASSTGEDQVALRDDRRYLARLLRSQKPRVIPSLPLRTNASYLVTGGLGGLGLAVARWLALQGARRIILLSRTQLPARNRWNEVKDSVLAKHIANIKEIESLGAAVHVARADVSNPEQMGSFFEQYKREAWPPICGVIHSAGLLQDALLLQLQQDKLEAVSAPKIAGTFLLHDLLKDQKLDFFILFSSISSLFGTPGQANYGAANAFLDSLAHSRQANGQAGLSINWGPWAEVGMAAQLNQKGGRLALKTIESFSPAAGIEALEILIGQNAVQSAVVIANWAEFLKTGQTKAWPLLSTLIKEMSDKQEVRTSASAQKPIREQLLAVEGDERQNLLQAYVLEQSAKALGISISKLEPSMPLTNLGLDSLMSVELRNVLESNLALKIPIIKLSQGSSVEDITAYLKEKLDVLTNTQCELKPAASTEAKSNVITDDYLLGALLDS